MIKTHRNQRNGATSAAFLARAQARSERRRRNSFWQFYRIEAAARPSAPSSGIEVSER